MLQLLKNNNWMAEFDFITCHQKYTTLYKTEQNYINIDINIEFILLYS